MSWCRLQHPRRIKAIIFKMVTTYGSSHPEVFYEKCILKICSKFTRDHPCGSMVFSCKFAAYFLNTFPRNTSAWLLLYIRTLYWEDYRSLGLIWQSKLKLLAVSLDKEKKVLSLFFLLLLWQ